jgi:dihydroorotate dehydrogenase electron transfer subunit
MLELLAPRFPASHPGQFLQVRCGDQADTFPAALTWSRDESPSPHFGSRQGAGAFLRRPFSIADHWQDQDGQAHLVVISRTVGVGTRWLESLRPGQELNILGPLGRGFDIPNSSVPLVLVGGGVGIPPLLYLTRRLHERGHQNATAIFGATSRDLLPVQLSGEPAIDGAPRRCVELAGDAPVPAIITTDDGSLGLRGVVTDALRRWHDGRSSASPTPVVFACGPDPMLHAVAALTRKLRLDCQLCIERTMGCGLGTCLSCVVRVTDAARPEGWRWALACSDGPVFDRDTLLDYAVDNAR